MSLIKKTIALSAALGVVASLALAGAHGTSPEEQAAKARQSLMTLFNFNIAILGSMAKGSTEYDADTAGLAAANLAALTTLHMPTAWMQGSDNASIEGTNALPAIWENMADVGSKYMDLGKAAKIMAGAAGTDLDGLRSTIGGVGKACGACHETYRAKFN